MGSSKKTRVCGTKPSQFERITATPEDAYALMQFFRALKFPPGDIYLDVFGDRTLVRVVQGALSFTVTVGTTPGANVPAFTAVCKKFIESANDGAIPDTELKRAYDAMLARVNTQAMLVRLLGKGITPPWVVQQ